MAIPARCNKRACQARRNLTKRPELFVRWPTCHMPGCNGKMYVDKYRLRKGPKDHPPICRDDCRPWSIKGGPHRVNDPQCKHYDEYILNKSFEPVSKHNPHPVRKDTDPPF